MIKEIFQKNILKICIFIFFYVIAAALWITDPQYSNGPSLFFYFFSFAVIFGIPGFFLTERIISDHFFERIVVSLFSGYIIISVISFTVCSFLNIKITSLNIILTSLIVSASAYFLLRYKKKTEHIYKKENIYKLIVFFIITVFVWYSYMITYDPNEELIYSIDRWCDVDITTCWLNASLLIIDYEKDLKTYDFSNARNVLHTGPNITLGNVALCSTLLELYHLFGWRLLYFLQGFFICSFLFFILLKQTNLVVSALISVLCACNPFFLNMQNPDRNVIAVMIAVFMYYMYVNFNRNYFLFGIMSGTIISTGLRHMPAVISVSFFYLYFFTHRKFSKKSLIYVLEYSAAVFYYA